MVNHLHTKSINVDVSHAVMLFENLVDATEQNVKRKVDDYAEQLSHSSNGFRWMRNPSFTSGKSKSSFPSMMVYL